MEQEKLNGVDNGRWEGLTKTDNLSEFCIKPATAEAS